MTKFTLATAETWMRGSMTALVTPFSQGAIDFDNVQRLAERQIQAGTHGLVPAGTTGESPTLPIDEHIEIVRKVVDVNAGRVPVIAGIGSNDTSTSVQLAEAMAKAGADALLAVAGYYNKPSQAGLMAHFHAVAEATDLPVIVYNVPGRTAAGINVETLASLSKLKTIAAIKDATGDLARVPRERLACVEGFIQLSGEDLTAVGFNVMGGQGCISVTSNVAPELCAQQQNACLEGRWDDARALQDKLAPLHDALFADTSPGPAKYAMARLGLLKEELRLPLVPASAHAKAAVERALEGLELL